MMSNEERVKEIGKTMLKFGIGSDLVPDDGPDGPLFKAHYQVYSALAEYIWKVRATLPDLGLGIDCTQ